jgi:hypothetical protein
VTKYEPTRGPQSQKAPLFCGSTSMAFEDDGKYHIFCLYEMSAPSKCFFKRDIFSK